jgi:hypothetical protein
MMPQILLMPMTEFKQALLINEGKTINSKNIRFRIKSIFRNIFELNWSLKLQLLQNDLEIER